MKILGICCGNGLILHPFNRKDILGGIEPRSLFHTPKEEQWRSNFNDLPFRRDLNYFQGTKPEVIIGAPDCGHSSILSYSRKKSLGKPEKNHSLALYIEGVNLFKPKIFLMENLPKLLDTFGLDNLKEAFPNYDLIIKIGPVSDFGNSQIHRKRLLVIGIQKESGFFILDPVKPIKLPKSGKLIKGLKKENLELGNIREPLTDIITMYAGKKLSLDFIRERWLTGLKNKSRWPVKNRKFTSAPAVYINRKNSYPATARKANRQFNHWGLQMTPRELARIQGAPDDFKIYIHPTNHKYWINKGRTTVTKTFPYEISTWFKFNLIKNGIIKK